MSTLLIRLAHRDERVLLALVRRRDPLLDLVMRTVTHLGDAVLVIGLCAVLAAGALPELTGTGRFAAAILALSHLIVQLIKRTVSRPRPVLPVGTASLIEAPDRFSFPSGHAAAALSVALGLATALPGPVAGLVLLLAALVGLSRCYLGVHYPGDVLVAWIVTVLCAAVLAPIIP